MKKILTIILSLILIYSLFLIGDYSQLIDYYESSKIQNNKSNSLDFKSILTKKLNINDEIKGFDIKSYCFRKSNNWKWKPLFIIYNSLIDQHEYFDSQLNRLLINKNITLQDIKNFTIEFNQRTE
jgi:hypothetical protein